MGFLMIWPLLVVAMALLYRWHVLRQVELRNERITRAYVEAVERSMEFQRELFEAAR
ncbi:hypothetical protein [Massilia sp. CT11-137]|uniref:hypothetical protein n=1 Tax=Massilia sp. CT11-137 TaxID=3393901 RepID=UPI0039AFFC03